MATNSAFGRSRMRQPLTPPRHDSEEACDRPGVRPSSGHQVAGGSCRPLDVPQAGVSQPRRPQQRRWGAMIEPGPRICPCLRTGGGVPLRWLQRRRARLGREAAGTPRRTRRWTSWPGLQRLPYYTPGWTADLSGYDACSCALGSRLSPVLMRHGGVLRRPAGICGVNAEASQSANYRAGDSKSPHAKARMRAYSQIMELRSTGA